MIFTKSRTLKEWVMTAQQAKALADELIDISEEANDHREPQCSQLIVDMEGRPSETQLVIIVIPDKKDEYED